MRCPRSPWPSQVRNVALLTSSPGPAAQSQNQCTRRTRHSRCVQPSYGRIPRIQAEGFSRTQEAERHSGPSGPTAGQLHSCCSRSEENQDKGGMWLQVTAWRGPKLSVWSTTAAQPRKPPERALRSLLPGSRARWRPQPEFQAPIPYSHPPGVPTTAGWSPQQTLCQEHPCLGPSTRQAYHRDPVFPAHREGKASSSWVWAAFLGNAESGQSLKARVALVVKTHVLQP